MCIHQTVKKSKPYRFIPKIIETEISKKALKKIFVKNNENETSKTIEK
jgi:hypothetical protein